MEEEERISATTAPPPARRCTLLPGPLKLSAGCPMLDACLGGGLDVCPVTEISGEAGVGKTQLLLALLVSAQLERGQGGLGGGSFYISTEGRPALSRLREIADARSSLFDYDPLSRIWHTVVSDANELWNLLVERVPLILASGHVKLVVIDSIAAVLRGEFSAVDDDTANSNRSEWYFGMSNMLKIYSDSFGCVFVVANQVSCDLKTGLLKPALGLAWSYCVNQRIVLQFVAHHEDTENEVGNQAMAVPGPEVAAARVRPQPARSRVLIVAFSPFRNDGVVPVSCTVNKAGFRGVESIHR